MSYESKEKSRNKQLGITWEIRYGKKEADKKKKKLSKKNKGRRPWIKGKHHTKESKEKMSNSHKGRSYEEKVGVEKAKKWIENKVLSYLKTINKKKNEKSNNN